MSDELSTTSAPPTMPPQLRVARLEDWEQIHRVEAAHLETSQPLEDVAQLVAGQPVMAAPGDRWPIGWVLEDNLGTVVGSLLNIPTLYHFRGRELINAVGRAGPSITRSAATLCGCWMSITISRASICSSTTPLALWQRSDIVVIRPGSHWESGVPVLNWADKPSRLCPEGVANIA